MQSGTLNRRVIIKRKKTTQDDYGEPVEGWQEVDEIWGNVRHLSGLETVRGGAQTSEVRASVRVRFKPGISAAMVADVEGKTYQIDAVLVDVKNREYMDLICKVM